MMLELVFSTKLIIAIILPFFGTLLGSAMVFALKKQINEHLLKLLLGFASGVMIAASIWSLLEPSISSYDSSDYKKWLIPVIGFLVGLIFIFVLDILIPHMHIDKKEEGINKHNINSTLKLILTLLIHNIPEGLAVGMVIASAMNMGVSETAALTLSIGIAIQNFPEGLVVSIPLKETGISKFKAFIHGSLSGVIELLIALFVLLISAFATPIIPFMLAFAAGAMIYVVADELLPEANEGKRSAMATIGVAIGFIIMMVLNLSLS